MGDCDINKLLACSPVALFKTYTGQNKERIYESKRSKTNYRIDDKNQQDARPILQSTSMGMQNRREACEGPWQRMRWMLCNEGQLYKIPCNKGCAIRETEGHQ